MTCMEYGFASPRHAEFPPMVVASIVNICNLACIHCHYSTYASRPDYRPHMMEWDIWTKLCDEMAAHPWSILNLGPTASRWFTSASSTCCATPGSCASSRST